MRTKKVDGVTVKLTRAEEKARDIEEAAALIEQKLRDVKEDERAQKLSGIDLDGKLCSATRNDQNGLTAIAMGVLLARNAGSKFPNTKFEFENGAELLITDANFDGFYQVWVEFRQAFFAP